MGIHIPFSSEALSNCAHTTSQLQGATKDCLLQPTCNGCAFLGHWFQCCSVHGKQCLQPVYRREFICRMTGVTEQTLAGFAWVANNKGSLKCLQVASYLMRNALEFGFAHPQICDTKTYTELLTDEKH